MRTQAGLSIAVCALLAWLACLPMFATSTASAATSDPLRAYRVDQPLRLDAGQSGSYTLACQSGDLVTDGTWLVDGLDDYNPQLGGQPFDLVSGVDVLEADAVSEQGYRFRLRNNTPGQAQINLTVSCLDGDVGSEGRQLRLLPRTAAQATNTTIAPGLGLAPRVVCAPGSIAVAAGFRFDGDPGAVGRVITRAPLDGSTTTTELGVAAIDPIIASSSARCLALTTTKGPDGRRHRLSVAYRTAQTSVSDGRREAYTLSCRSRETAIEGGFRLSEAWYLGQAQAGRQRSFRVQSPATGNPGTATLGLLCLLDHTSGTGT
jgi:hypothetical protein